MIGTVFISTLQHKLNPMLKQYKFLRNSQKKRDPIRDPVKFSWITNLITAL